jgi:hypothetical protein
MFIKETMVLIGLSVARERVAKGEDVHKRSKSGRCGVDYERVEEGDTLVAGNLYKELKIRENNLFMKSGLSAKKLKDGSVEFGIYMDYDIYETEIDKESSAELVNFLKKPFNSIEEEEIA